MKITKTQQERLYYFSAVVLIALCFFSRWFFLLWIPPIVIYGTKILRKKIYGVEKCYFCRREKCSLDFSTEKFPALNDEHVCKACVSDAEKLQKGQDKTDEALRGAYANLQQLNEAMKKYRPKDPSESQESPRAKFEKKPTLNVTPPKGDIKTAFYPPLRQV